MGVFDQGAVIMFISAEDDEIGKFLNANEMFFTAFGYEPEEAIGQSIEKFMPK